jgi:16S rRNA (cytidine1402-2'-O)-methyltransferase
MNRAALQKQKYNQPLEPGLYIVSTPIGNSLDISLRALNVFSRADNIICEDTRITKKLLSIHNIETSLSSYHEFNAERARPLIIKKIKDKKIIALVSDAGTPLISDPGYKLVRACIDENIPVTSVPGASSVIASLTVSGLPTNEFFFGGFLPKKKLMKIKKLKNLSNIPSTIIIFESTKRLVSSCEDILKIFGSRQASVVRELTKKHEEIVRSTLPELINQLKNRESIKGETIILIGPDMASQKKQLADENIVGAIDNMVKFMSVKDIGNTLVKLVDMKKKEIYEIALLRKKKCK